MPLVSSVCGMHFACRQHHLNSLGCGGGKDTKIFKGKVLHSPAKAVSDQAAGSPCRSQKARATPRPLLISVLEGCAAAQQLLFYDCVSHISYFPIPLRYLHIWFIFPFKRDNVFDDLFMVTAQGDNDTQNSPKLNIIILPLWLCYF